MSYPCLCCKTFTAKITGKKIFYETLELMLPSSSPQVVVSTSSLDSICTEWNACSLEVLSQFQTDQNSIDSPLVVIGCYQLIENQSKDLTNCAKVDEKVAIEANVKQDDSAKERQQQRMGQLRLYSLQSSPSRNNPCSFGRTTQITTLKDGGGVLDMKWLPKPVSLGEKRALNCIQPSKRYILACALSSGSIQLYSLENEGDVIQGHPHHLSCIATSSPPHTPSVQNLCLSLDWEYRNESSVEIFTPSSTQIVSSYSNGQVAVHTAKWGDYSNYTTTYPQTRSVEGTPKCALEETLRFDAHTLFREPSEVWTCCWCRCTSGTVTILSGADDSNLKGWDTRISTHKRPLFCIKEHEAGVTALSWHPREQYIFASGSYDEGVRIWDIRVVSNNDQHLPRPMAKLNSCGGGIWRLKWHPRDSTKLLVAAMHGGCHVLHIPALLNKDDNKTERISNPYDNQVDIVSSFSEHKSMAYGVDWLPATWLANEKNSELRYLVASCSFYDQKAFLWDPSSIMN